MKRILMLVGITIGFMGLTSFANAQDDSNDQQQTESIGQGAKAGKLSKAERKAMRAEKKAMHKMHKMKKEMKAEADETEGAVHHKSHKRAKAKVEEEKVEDPIMPTDEQIQKADDEDNSSGAGDSDPE
jgi:hypothetical protein